MLINRPKQYKNLKNGKTYLVDDDKVITNATTNKNEGQEMRIYSDFSGNFYVREINEFNEKFKLVTDYECKRCRVLHTDIDENYRYCHFCGTKREY